MHERLVARELTLPVYAFSRCGVRPLADAYRALVAQYDIDLIVLVDGGTDSLIFGDEPGLGTVVEDAVSIIAACQANGHDRTLLATTGLGIDQFHGVSNYSFLENTARLNHDGNFLGSVSVVHGTPEAYALYSLVEYANRRQPSHRSIVCNSLVSAIEGEFGGRQVPGRTEGGEIFIHPLMAQYWVFYAEAVAASMRFGDALAETETFAEASLVIETVRETLTIRRRLPLPL